LKNWKLYVILDKQLIGSRNIKILTEEVVKGGADVIQLRDKISSARDFIKDAETVRAITRQHGIQFIVNDRIDIAKAVYADGVHLGQSDIPIEKARSILNRFKIIGISCHSAEEALNAQSQGADYIGWGPIFKTSTKINVNEIGVDSIDTIKKLLNIPVVCIGGINMSNIKGLLDRGVKTVAVASAVIFSKDPRIATQEIKNSIVENQHDTVGICPE